MVQDSIDKYNIESMSYCILYPFLLTQLNPKTNKYIPNNHGHNGIAMYGSVVI